MPRCQNEVVTDSQHPGAILVTGGTGQLGRPTVDLLRQAAHEVRVLSRSPGEGRVLGDLRTGAGLAEALNGVHTVIHLATNNRKDSPATRTLLEACRTAGVRHVIYQSIVGVDEIPYLLYRDKVVCEQLVAGSGIPFTILRATQFHTFVGGFFRMQRRLPVQLALAMPVQPIAIPDVATRLAELAAAAPAGRVPDLGGPEVLTVAEAGDIWQRAHGTSRKQWRWRLPGRTFAAYAAGFHANAPRHPGQTFAEYAAQVAAEDQASTSSRS